MSDEQVLLDIATTEFWVKMLRHVSECPLPGEEDVFPELTKAYRAGFEGAAQAIETVLDQYKLGLETTDEASDTKPD